jgi:hypothetical protein
LTAPVSSIAVSCVSINVFPPFFNYYLMGSVNLINSYVFFIAERYHNFVVLYFSKNHHVAEQRYIYFS